MTAEPVPPAPPVARPGAHAAPPGGLVEVGSRPLEGYLVGITADRRKDELATLLERRGARTEEEGDRVPVLVEGRWQI